MFKSLSILFLLFFFVNLLQAQSYNVLPSDIPMGCAKIKAKIVMIEPVKRKNKTAKDIYLRMPSIATVQLIEIVAYGRDADAFPITESFKAFFTYTLLMTNKELFPEVNLPGLKKGDVFTAFIRPEAAKGANYTILQYEK